MPFVAPPQSIPSSYTWGAIFDMQRRLGAGGLSVSGPDQLAIAQQVSSFLYTREMWPFTLTTGSIQCQNGVQDYPSPNGLRAVSRAWFRVPSVVDDVNNGTVPPYDDPSAIALAAAALSANYVGSLGGGGTPAAYIYPGSGSMSVVKRLPPNLNMWGYTSIREITQQPNSGLLRLSAATAVAGNQPYSLELEYQPVRPPINALTELLWMPDDYAVMAQAGILYYLYTYNNDPRAGTVSYNESGTPSYSGQYAVWMASIRSAAAAEREGSVNNFTPDTALGADDGAYQGWFA